MLSICIRQNYSNWSYSKHNQRLQGPSDKQRGLLYLFENLTRKFHPTELEEQKKKKKLFGKFIQERQIKHWLNNRHEGNNNIE